MTFFFLNKFLFSLIMFFTLVSEKKIISFFQLYNFLIQSFESSLINKKIMTKNISKSDGYIVKSDSINKNNDAYEDSNLINDIDNQASLVDRDLQLIKNMMIRYHAS